MLDTLKRLALNFFAWLLEPVVAPYEGPLFVMKDAPHQAYFFSQLEDADFSAREVNDYVGFKVAAPMAYFTDAGTSGWVVRVFERDTDGTMGYVAYE